MAGGRGRRKPHGAGTQGPALGPATGPLILTPPGGTPVVEFAAEPTGPAGPTGHEGTVVPSQRPPSQRHRRQSLTFAALCAVVLLAGLLALGHWLRWWTFGEPADEAAGVPCPAQTVVAPPEVSVRVVNGTDRAGLARSMAGELRARGFRVPAVSNDASGRRVTGVAVVRHGPSGLLAARSVAAQFAPDGVVLEDDGRDTDAVDVVIGQAYRAMVARDLGIAAATPPVAPDDCVPVSLRPEPSAAPTPGSL